MGKDSIKKASNMIKNSSKTMVLTGAGLSTESGIPDFRSPDTGLWENVDPMEILSVAVLYNNPRRFYKEGFKILLEMTDAKPNQGHYALAEMERLGFIKGVITQNIDNLHNAAGSKYILEVHGNTREGSCIDCGNTVDIKELIEKVEDDNIPPRCDKCKGVLRPDVVFFGDMLPEEFTIAWEEASSSDLLIVVGSSLSVAPVNYLPHKAKKLILINKGQTAMDKSADLIINGSAGEILTNILDELKE